MKNFSKVILLFMVFCAASFHSQERMKDYSRIMSSTNVYEIEAFLRDAHPDDPKRIILRPRLIKMLREYIKNAKAGDQRVKEYQEKISLLVKRGSTKISFDEMNAKIRQAQIAKFQRELAEKGNYSTKVYGASSPAGLETPKDQLSSENAASNRMSAEEDQEFKMLMSENPIEHKNRTVKILNSLFDNDPNSAESIVMITNKSKCNMIMRIEGVGYTKYRLPVPANGDNTIVVKKGDYLFSSIVCGSQYSSQKTVQKAIMVSLGEN